MKSITNNLIKLLLFLEIILSSCSKEEQNKLLYIDDNVINFVLSEGQNSIISAPKIKTRAVELTDFGLSNFSVFAYYMRSGSFNRYSISNYMYNQKVEKKTDTWEYSPIKYWPSDGSLSFFAYAPYLGSISNDIISFTPSSKEGMPAITYTALQDVTKQIDLLIAEPLYNQVRKSNSVQLNFKHGLARIEFNAKKENTLSSEYQVKIKEISIENLKNKATYLSSWSINNSSFVNYILSTKNCLLRNIFLTHNFQSISFNDKILMPIPQVISDDMIVKVKFDYFYQGSSQEYSTISKLNQLIPIIDKGKRYIINILVNGASDIGINCEILPWKVYNIIIPPFN